MVGLTVVACRIERIDMNDYLWPDATPEVRTYAANIQGFLHHGADGRIHIVQSRMETYPLDVAHARWFGIRRWRKLTVGTVGALRARIEDQKAIGRPRRPGERSPAPLPDWYDLTHLAYEHAADLGWDPSRDIYQLLPAAMTPDDGFVNFAEALHLLQPA